MSSVTHSTKLIPLRILLGNPEKTSPQISPDGTKMAYLAPVNDVLNVWVGSVDSENYQPVTKDEERGVRFYFWAEDNKHILYIQDVQGNENGRLYATHLETHETRDLTPFENVQVHIIDHDKHFPNELLIGMNKDNPQIHDVYHLDLISGNLELAIKNPGNVVGWMTDANFKVRGAFAARPDGGFDLLVRENEQAEWRILVTYDAEDALNSRPITFSEDGQSLYLIDSRNATCAPGTARIAAGRTTIIAAHRLSTVRNADVIFVLSGGRLAESGTHDALLRLGGRYARLVAEQHGVL